VDNSLKDDLFKAINGFKRKGHLKTWDIDMSPGEFFLLTHIKSTEEETGVNGVFVSELSEILKMSMPAVSQQLKSLDKKELIVRDVDKDDRRKITVSISEKGQKFLKCAQGHMDKIITNIILQVGEDDVREFIRIIMKMGKAYKDNLNAPKNERNDLI